MAETLTSSSSTTTAGGNSEVGGISDAQKEKNLHTASHLVAAQMGIDINALDYNQRLAYTRALSLVITKYPTRFSAQSVINAQDTLQKNRTPLDDTGFDISAFGSAFVDNAVKVGLQIGKVGQNALDAVENTSWVLKWGLPVILLGGLALFVFIRSGGKISGGKIST